MRNVSPMQKTKTKKKISEGTINERIFYSYDHKPSRYQKS